MEVAQQVAATGFILRLTGLPNATRAIANLTVDELKRRGCNVEILSDETQGEGLEEVEIGAPNPADVTDILSKLEELQLIARSTPKDQSYDEDDEAVIRQRLEGLGYL